MPELIIPVVAIGLSFTTLIIFCLLFFITRHRERLALLEYDRTYEVFGKRESRSALKWGLVLAGGGLSLFIGSLLEYIGVDEVTAYFSTLMLGTGLGLLAYYSISLKQQQYNS